MNAASVALSRQPRRYLAAALALALVLALAGLLVAHAAAKPPASGDLRAQG